MAKSDWETVKSSKATKPVKSANGDAKPIKKPVVKVEAAKTNGTNNKGKEAQVSYPL